MEYCCEALKKLLTDDENSLVSHPDYRGKFVLGGYPGDSEFELKFCPYCGTKIPEPWYDQAVIDMANAALLARPSYDTPEKKFTYLNREQTKTLLSYADRDTAKRVTPQGHWSGYRIYYCGKYRWRDRTTLHSDQRLQTTVHDEMRGPNFGARVTEDAIYVIFED